MLAHYGVNQTESNGITRTTIAMQNDKKGPNGWSIGVCSPMPKDKMTPDEKKRREGLDKELGEGLDKELGDKLGSGKVTDWWPWNNRVEGDKRDWDPLIPDLHEECYDSHNNGKITEYFVGTFLEIAKVAIPIIDKIETGSGKT